MGVSRYLNLTYLFIVGTQLFGMLALDLVEFYPKALWQPPSSPLHFLVTLRDTYVSFSGDPFFSSAAHEPWFQAFIYIEALVQFPLAAYLVYKLSSASSSSKSGTSPGTELAGLAFGCLTGMGSVVCCYHIMQLGEDVIDAQKKASLFYGTYMPFSIVPIVMALDMHSRLLARISDLEKKAKSH